MNRMMGSILRENRQKLGFSLSELARRSGISRAHLHSVESGKSNLSSDKLITLAQALGLLVSNLIGEVEGWRGFGLNIPDPLVQFADENDLQPTDVILLYHINQWAECEQSKTDYAVIMTVIRGITT